MVLGDPWEGSVPARRPGIHRPPCFWGWPEAIEPRPSQWLVVAAPSHVLHVCPRSLVTWQTVQSLTCGKVNKGVCSVLKRVETMMLFTWRSLKINRVRHFWVLVQRECFLIWYSFSLTLTQEAVDDGLIRVPCIIIKTNVESRRHVIVQKIINIFR